eukprot:SAG31_NODE_47700_length_226_cov_15.677165_1_plen_75_part_11
MSSRFARERVRRPLVEVQASASGRGPVDRWPDIYSFICVCAHTARVPWQESVIVPESLQLCSLYDSRVFITKLQS